MYRFIPNTVAAIQALRSGHVDLAIPEPEQFADLVKEAKNEPDRKFDCISYWNPGVPFYYIGWNQDMVFFKDKRVRLAMTHLINREQIVEELLEGSGRTISGPFHVFGKQNDPAIKPWPYDLARARELLEHRR